MARTVVRLFQKPLHAAIDKIAEPKIREVTENGVAFAQSIAPVETGTYRDSIHAELGKNEDGRTVGVIVTDAVAPNEFHYSTSVEARHGTIAKTIGQLTGKYQARVESKIGDSD